MASGTGEGPYSLYTGTLVAGMRQPGPDIEQILTSTRIQINRVTSAAQTPWMATSLTNQF